MDEELKKWLMANLELKLETGDFTDPNNVRIQLMLDGKEISAVNFSVRQAREYEG